MGRRVILGSRLTRLGACCLAVYLFSFVGLILRFPAAKLILTETVLGRLRSRVPAVGTVDAFPQRSLVHGESSDLNNMWSRLIEQDKTQLSTAYPTLFLLNALVFMLVFFLARILFGGYQVTCLCMLIRNTS